eukprot:4172999-Lingulodinium_polyedra.AAC.1
MSYVPVLGSEKVYPVFEALSMGWSWSLFFANSGTLDVARSATGIDSVLVDREPAPVLGPGRTITSTY